MKIAIIAWGSVIWDPRGLPREGMWQDDGPELKIEFSRISNDARLTLVIDLQNGTPCKTKHILSSRTSREDATEDLRAREGTVCKQIGWVNTRDGTHSGTQYDEQARIHSVIDAWCKKKGYEGAVWTALPPSFYRETRKEYSTDEALMYLRALPRNVRNEAMKYILKAPDCVQTELRRRAEKEIDG